MMATAQLTAQVSTKGVSKAESDLKKLTRASNNAEKSTNKLEEGFKSVGRNASAAIAAVDGPLGGIASRITALTTVLTSGTAIATGFGVAIAAIGSAVSLGVSNLDAYNVSLKRVNATIKATGDAVGFTAEQLQDQAAALALSTLTSTQEVQAAQAQLLTFNRVLGETFTRAIELSQDLAEAGFGNIRSNAVQLGKALQDPIRGVSALTEVGVTFNNTQREQIKLLQESGDVFAAQAIVIEALESQVAGVAAAVATNTLAGDLDTLGQRFEEFTIKVAASSGALSASQIVVQGWILAIEKATELLEGPTNSELFEQNLDLIFKLNEAEQYLETLQKGSSEYDRQTAAVARLSGQIEANRQVIESRANAENAARIAAGEAQEREAEQRKKIQEELIAEQDRIAAEQLAKEEARRQETFNRNQAAAQKELERLEAANDSELEAISRREFDKLALIRSFKEEGLITEQEFTDAETEILRTATDARTELRKKEADEATRIAEEQARDQERIEQRRNDLAIDALRDTTASLKSTLGEQNALYKASAITKATIDTYNAANGAYAALASIPIVGPALGAAAAGVAIGAGLANVQQIASAREQGGQISSGRNVLVGERGPEIISTGAPATVLNAQQTRGFMSGTGESNVNITVIDQSSGNKDFTTEQNEQGDIILLIRDTVSNDLAQSNSRISKSFSRNYDSQRSR